MNLLNKLEKEENLQDEHVTVHFTRTYTIRRKDIMARILLSEKEESTEESFEIITYATILAIEEFTKDLPNLSPLDDDFKIKLSFQNLS